MKARPLGPRDAEAVSALLVSALGPRWTTDAVAEELARRGALTLGVFDTERPTAVLLGFTVADELEISIVAVEAGARRRGLARGLVQSALDDARRRGVARAFLEVRPSNLAARALYRALGFEESGRRAGYYENGEDALVMQRAL